MITLYGIPNCDTVKKARKWLTEKQLDYRFHDLRTDGLDKELLERWLSQLSWQELLNKRSTSWRNLPETKKNALTLQQAIDIMLEQPTIIKRPLVDNDGKFSVGFKEQEFCIMFSR